MRVAEILDRKGNEVHAVGRDLPVREAIALLADLNIGTLLVTNADGSLTGILSERDLIRTFSGPCDSIRSLRVSDLATRSVITCAPETTIGDALTLMAVHRIRHLPVVLDNKILGLISIRDVLEFRLEAMEESFVALTRAEREASLAREEAERSNRAKSEFLANMSHELRTPLNAVIGFSEIIASEHLGAGVNEVYRQYARHINASGSHLLNLVNEVLDLSKIDAGQLELVDSTVDLGALLRECADLLEVLLTEKQLSLVMTVPNQLPPLTADALRLKQALLNLLSNAIKFSHVGGSVEARVHSNGDGDLAVAIIDHGSGMRPEDIPIALEPFCQIDCSATLAREGTGLGLPLAKMLVEQHGGTLSLISSLGEGTVVNISIPEWRVNWASVPRSVAN